MRQGLLISAMLAAFVAMTPASFAFEFKSAPSNSDGSAKFSNPDNLTDGMARDLSQGGSGTSFHIGNSTLNFSGGAGSESYGMSPALQERLMLGPNAAGGTGIPH